MSRLFGQRSCVRLCSNPPPGLIFLFFFRCIKSIVFQTLLALSKNRPCALPWDCVLCSIRGFKVAISIVPKATSKPDDSLERLMGPRKLTVRSEYSKKVQVNISTGSFQENPGARTSVTCVRAYDTLLAVDTPSEPWRPGLWDVAVMEDGAPMRLALTTHSPTPAGGHLL